MALEILMCEYFMLGIYAAWEKIHTLSKACHERLDLTNQLNAELIALKAKTRLNNNETWLKRIFKN